MKIKTKPEGKAIITHVLRDIDNNLVYYKTNKMATKCGTGSHVVLPKDLMDKEIKIIYREKVE